MFQRRYTLLVIRKVPLQIDLSWLLLMLLVMWSMTSAVYPTWYENLPLDDYWTMGMLSALGLLVSVVLHEVAHTVVATLRGFPPARVQLFLFGGVPEWERDPRSPGDEGWAAVAGPLCSALVALGLWTLSRTQQGFPDQTQGVLTFLLFVNLLLCVVNLLPAVPLDGGRILQACLWRWTGERLKAAQITSALSGSLGTLLLMVAAYLALTRSLSAGLWWFLVGLFVRHASRTHLQQATIQETLRGESLESFLHENPVVVPEDSTVMEFVQLYMLRHEQRRFPIVNQDGFLLGCVTPRELATLPQERWALHKVSELYRPWAPEQTISPNADALQALLQMTRERQSFLLVVEQNRVVGEIRLQELLDFLTHEEEPDSDSTHP